MKDILLTALLSAFLTSAIVISVDNIKNSKCEKRMHHAGYEKGMDRDHHKKGKHHAKKMKPNMDKYKEFDVNGDEQLSKEEYLNMKIDHFNKLDDNKDGVLTKEEMKKARDKARAHFKKMHRDGGPKKPHEMKREIEPVMPKDPMEG